MKALITALFLFGTLSANQALAASEPLKEATLYKNPECGCCTGYANYLQDNGYKITVVPTDYMAMVKQSQGITDDMASCHTMIIDGYAVEGHVPVGIVDKLLAEHPNISGIYLPGMPMGSPGMSGPKEEPFKVYPFTKGKEVSTTDEPFAVE